VHSPHSAIHAFELEEGTLAEYRVHFVDRSDRVVNALVVEHETDGAAIEHANRVYVSSIGNGFDVWREDELVYRHARD
jgi:hypothetical protein